MCLLSTGVYMRNALRRLDRGTPVREAFQHVLRQPCQDTGAETQGTCCLIPVFCFGCFGTNDRHAVHTCDDLRIHIARKPCQRVWLCNFVRPAMLHLCCLLRSGRARDRVERKEAITHSVVSFLGQPCVSTDSGTNRSLGAIIRI